METIKCNNSQSVSVKFIKNGGAKDEILVFALIDNEFWFAIGNGHFYKTENAAKKATIREMNKFGYTFDNEEMEKLNII